MSLTAYGLQCQHRAEPLGVDEPHPSFGWKLAASSPGRSQQAYRLTVRRAGAPEPSWDSGWTEDARHDQVVYAGPPLRPSTRYTWDVQLTDDQGRRGEPGRELVRDRWLLDVIDEQDEDGAFGDVAPRIAMDREGRRPGGTPG